jgi:ribonuclease Z
MTKGLEDAYKDVARYWVPKANPGFNVVELSSEGVIFEGGALKITAFFVDHYMLENGLSFGCRIDYNGRSIVISGDTGYSKNLINYAKGTDILFHEAFMVLDNAEPGQDKKFSERLRKIHTTSEVVSQVFEEAQTKMGVAYHISNSTNEYEALMKSRLSSVFKGEVIIGEDLMTFEIDINGNISQIK